MYLSGRDAQMPPHFCFLPTQVRPTHGKALWNIVREALAGEEATFEKAREDSTRAEEILDAQNRESKSCTLM